MKALTLVQPGAWAIAYSGCDILNRPAAPAGLKPTEYVAIHAGKGWDSELFAWLRLNAISLGIPLCPERAQHHSGKILAVCQIPGHFEVPDVKKPRPSNPWFRGPFGWHLSNVVRLPDPVECRGASSHEVFEIPEGVEGAVRLSLERRRACFSCERAREQRRGPPTCPLREDPAVHDAGGCAGWRPR